MRLMLTFARQYPGSCAIALAGLAFASLAEGIGLSTLLPLLNQVTAQATPPGSQGGLSGALVAGFERLNIDPTALMMLIVIALGLTLKAVATLLAYRQVGYIVAYIATDLRLALLRALSASSWGHILHQRAGGLANAAATEANRSANAFYRGAAVVALCVQAIAYTVVAFLVNWQLTLAALALAPVLFLLLGRFVGMARKAGRRQQNLFAALLASLIDSLQSLKSLKAMGRETQTDRMLEQDTTRLKRALRKEVLSTEALKAVQQWSIGLSLVVGAYIALVELDMALSSVTVFAVVLSRMFIVLGKMQQQYQKLAVAEPFYWSLRSSIQAAENARETAGGRTSPTLERGIRLQGLSFGYETQRVLDGVDLEIPAGRFTALVGPSGAGKTTLVDLLIGLLWPNEGRVLVDGVALDEIDLRQWRRMIGYVPQETVLLHGSVLHNVTVGDPTLSEQDAIWALQQAEAWEFVQRLDAGIHSMVGERGSRLSGGQRQRVLIARALAHRPKLLILDEATSALDPETELSICRTLEHLKGDLTLMAISHRGTLTLAADLIYRIQGGKVVCAPGPAEQGTMAAR